MHENKETFFHKNFLNKLPQHFVGFNVDNSLTHLSGSQQQELLEDLRIEFSQSLKYVNAAESPNDLEKLALIAVIIKLLLTLDKSEQLDEILIYRDKMQSCYEDVCKDDSLFLTNAEKAQLSFIVGKANSILDCYSAVIVCYEQAVDFAKYDLNDTTIIHRYGLALIEMNIKVGLDFQMNGPAPDITKSRYESAIKVAEEMLNIKPSSLSSKIYYFKSQTLVLLAEHNCSRQYPNKAIENLLTSVFFWYSRL